MRSGNPATHLARIKYFISPERELNIVSALEGTSVLPLGQSAESKNDCQLRVCAPLPMENTPSPFWTSPGVQGVPLQGADTGVEQFVLTP